jgi:hypothetical protein
VRKLFTASNILEAQLLDLMLKQDGVSSHVKNDGLQSGVGEIPFVEMWPEVWILEAEHWVKATHILRQFQQTRVTGDWVCPHCSEANPGTFETCWSCAGV